MVRAQLKYVSTIHCVIFTKYHQIKPAHDIENKGNAECLSSQLQVAQQMQFSHITEVNKI